MIGRRGGLEIVVAPDYSHSALLRRSDNGIARFLIEMHFNVNGINQPGV